MADIAPRETDAALQAGKLDLLRNLDRRVADRYGPVDEMDAAIANYELAFRMQTSVPELAAISGETEATRKLYGLDEKETEDFGRACLLARRMVERGVRFIELLPPKREGADRWDQHARLKQGHLANAKATDKPIAGLLKDLKSHGLLDQTLVLWGGEFGRSPTAQGSGEMTGRDHHPYGFSMWLAGGGIKGGVTYGATDEYGYYATSKSPSRHIDLPSPRRCTCSASITLNSRFLRWPPNAANRRARSRGKRYSHLLMRFLALTSRSSA